MTPELDVGDNQGEIRRDDTLKGLKAEMHTGKRRRDDMDLGQVWMEIADGWCTMISAVDVWGWAKNKTSLRCLFVSS